MKKRIYAALATGTFLATSSLFATTTHTSSITDDTPFEEIRAQHPHKFIKPDFELLRTFEALYKDTSEEEKALLDASHREELVPLVRHWQTLFTSQNKPTTDTFVKEIEEAVTAQRVTLPWLTCLPLRFCASISQNPSPEERTTYDQEIFRGNFTLNAMLDAWEDHSVFKGVLDSYPPLKDLRFFAPRHIPENKILIPLLDRKTISVHSLVFAGLYNMAPVCIPLQEIKGRVHGITNPTPFGFALHDLLHGSISIFPPEKAQSIPSSIQPENTMDVPDHLKLPEETLVAPYDTLVCAGLKKYDIVMDALKFLAHKTLQNGLDNTDFRKVMFSIFLAHHEKTPWPQEVLLSPSLEESMDTLVAHVRGAFDGPLKTQNYAVHAHEEGKNHDRFHTSVLDGESFLSDEEISLIHKEVKHAPQNFPISLNYEYMAPLKSPNALMPFAKYVGESSITNERGELLNFTSVHIFSNNVHTLHYRIKDAEGTRHLLNYAGCDNSPAPLTLEMLLKGREASSFTQEEAQAASSQALAYLHTLAKESSHMLDAFSLLAKAYLNTPEAQELHRRHNVLMTNLATLLSQEEKAIGSL